jgi:hypothetical protein
MSVLNVEFEPLNLISIYLKPKGIEGGIDGYKL